MAVQKKVTTNLGGNLKSSLGGIKTGAILLAIGTVMLFANEGNFVKRDRSLKEAGANLVHVNDMSSLDSSLDGKLIHASGLADTQEMLEDPMFGINERAIKLNRQVEYYQYVESSSSQTKETTGGGTETVVTYSYSQGWVSSPVNSSGFEDSNYRGQNFIQLQIDSGSAQASNVTFGAYKLPPFIVNSISGSSAASVNLSEEQLQLLDGRLAKRYDGQMVHVNGNVVYFGQSASNPAIGDVRVTLTKTMPRDISIIAKVTSNSFDRYIAKNGREVSMVSMGIVSAESMIEGAKQANKVLTWILRILGITLVISGIKSMFSILPTLLKAIPFLGKIIGAGINLVCAIGGFAWSLVVISISWLFYRPLIGIPMLVVSVGGIVFLRIKSKNNKQPIPGVTDTSAAG